MSFSADEGASPAGAEEAGIQDEGQNQELEVMDVSQLTDTELKARLLQYGVNVGPIVASTRTLYEKKLRVLLKPVSQPPLNGAGYAAQYSDVEEDEDDDADDEEHDYGSVHAGGHLEADEEQDQVGDSPVGLRSQGDGRYYPQCFLPPSGMGDPISLTRRGAARSRAQASRPQTASVMSPRHASVDELRSPRCAFQSFSITELVEELESRSPDISKGATGSKDLMKDRNATSKSPAFSPKPSVFRPQFKANEPVSDILMEMFPGTERTPTGISATCRRPIKGAAGRPVQFKYPDTPSSPGTKERRELQRHLVPKWIQMLVFLLVAFLFYLIFSAMQDALDRPSTVLLDRSGHEGELLGNLSSFATSEDPPLVAGEE
ncbi:LEM domain-containing protein 1 isoform X2 [Brienomyrus brachyistius]|uniref:LEM domain-containing protein 1 isoform X2 n=1 Tax=Brienomyrus brachyistius TaxID=42636 RepID=UPI0020B43A05|nr:LEM domain-containing protein 1 isoform X2 [Brienomyrus brachyistius]